MIPAEAHTGGNPGLYMHWLDGWNKVNGFLEKSGGEGGDQVNKKVNEALHG